MSDPSFFLLNNILFARSTANVMVSNKSIGRATVHNERAVRRTDQIVDCVAECAGDVDLFVIYAGRRCSRVHNMPC